MTAVWFVGAAFVGTLIRVALSGQDRSFNHRLLATFTVNVLGAFLLGWLQGSDADHLIAVGVGGLGAMTTFSTFVAQVECIDREGRRVDAIAYVAATLIVGIGAAWVGHSIA